MADGSIGGQIRDNLAELGVSTAKAGVQAVTDIASGTAETVIGGGAVPNQMKPETQQASQGGQDPMVVKKQEKEIARKRQLSYVRQQLEAFRQRQAQVRAQEQQVKQQEEVQKLQMKQSEKARKDQEFLARLKRSYGGAHEGDSKALG
jgi:hypothetical protein